MRTTTAITLTAAALLALTACSSSEESSDAAPTKNDSASSPGNARTDDDSGVQEAVEDYTDAYFEGDADSAYDTLSQRCQKTVALEDYQALVEQASADYGDGHPAAGVTAKVSGGMARVSYKVEGLPKFDQHGQPWVMEGGDWKYDAC
ncbi:hypothetical protein ACFYP4_08265 [Streptomyces sp. NPDC005551]|uniref:hypothetical protein n=1 Tax=unclassified Streptomyces TaxID=2593676 RepID=UPI0033C57BF5